MDARSDLREARTPPGAYPVGRAQLLRASWPRGELPGMAVTAAVIEVALDPPIRGMDPLVSEVCGRPLSRVPVIRIYGPWGPGGPHCCLNLHGLFPYFYVPVPPEAYGNGAPSFLRAFARRLVLQADRLMASTARSSRGSRLVRGGGCGQSYVGDGLGPGGRTNLSGEPPPLVHKIEVVKRLPFYGYHREFHAFLKISLTIPSMVGPLAGLLLQGIVTGSPLQPFEVHLNFQASSLICIHPYAPCMPLTENERQEGTE
ncbi:DNA polymerase, related [Eimeria tenella]|uniref:DNA polymerase, related n=1 Tax=Eimeria tenella TaxID=5802 RepID=U6KGA1_EIMTE|nr:DNA polymerase, related [Eimeria tenella]CDJ36959.1 DNA polymerase, related [Eimeria tenella]|eukprot:XP_013227797.1 DNA polymerase, related [Eimeria tenella]